MVFDRDELNRRRAVREERRRKRQREVMILRIVIAAMVLTVAVIGMLILTSNMDGSASVSGTEDTLRTTEPPTETTTGAAEDLTEATDETTTEASTQPAAAPSESEDETQPDEAATVVRLAAAGDLNITDATVTAGLVEGGYDYSHVFMDVAPVFAEADLALLNFEGNLVGPPYGTEYVSAPQEMARALRDMGVDLVQLANSCSVNQGIKGLATTLDNVRKAGLEPMGAFATPEEFQKAKGYTVVDVQGVRIALVAFTKGVGGLSLPAGNEDCVNLLYTDYATTYQQIDKEGIRQILSSVATEKPDLTIALVHWGSEYKDLVTENQKDIAELMQDNGVDVILGTHSHMLHQIDFDPVSGQMVAYSLGDFFGNADRAGTDYSIILELEITKDNASGDTRVTGYTYTPIYTLTESTAPDGQRQVVRLHQAMEAYEADFVGKVSETVYKDMEYALERIRDRITPKTTEEE